MLEILENYIKTLNRLYKKQEKMYHELAVKLGLSDTTFNLLYELCSSDEEYTQNKFCEEWHYSKQTVNSAVNNLLKAEYIYFESVKCAGNKKLIKLTAKGKVFCETNIKPVIRAEVRSLKNFSDEEIKEFLLFYQKKLTYLERELKENL